MTRVCHTACGFFPILADENQLFDKHVSVSFHFMGKLMGEANTLASGLICGR